MNEPSQKIQWGWVVVGAVLLELALIAFFVPMLAWIGQEKVVPYVAPGVLVLGFLFGWWIGRKVRSRSLLHGVLVGVLATVLYLALCLLSPGGIAPVVAMYGPFLFVIGNAMRIIACAAGGFVSRPRRA